MGFEPIWTPFEHAILRKSQGLQGQKLLLATSGGVDSMVLLRVIFRLKLRDVSVAYIHHGPCPDAAQEEYRDQALVFVKSISHQYQFPFFSVKAEGHLSGEAALRDFRKTALKKIQQDSGSSFIAYAHHRDDLLETQMLKLIRGSALENPVMSELFQNEWRPFLETPKAEILSYASSAKVDCLQDPSNQSSDYLRNWLRNSWLPMLEAKCPGALNSMSRSLQVLQEVDKSLPETLWLEDGHLSRPEFSLLDLTAQKRALAVYGRRLGLRDFTQNHITEVLKHLDKTGARHKFVCAKMEWSSDTASIVARPQN
jgi:tRNA(Ile)-lysidine synthase